MMREPTLALSLRQPWAALVAAGRKSIEVRRWPSQQRGRIYIHAAKLPDNRPEAWTWVDDEARSLTTRVGGIIGIVEMTGCLEYRSPSSFRADRTLHFNAVNWYLPPLMYGFVLSRPKVIRFRPIIGNIKFFAVPKAKS